MVTARKRFGQNFLQDERVINNIVTAINPRAGNAILEIGPGHGALTGPLVASGADLTVIEIDRDLAAGISTTFPSVALVTEDVLKTDLTGLLQAASPKRVVGNLPYNISTPLLFRLFEHRSGIIDMHFMLQLEVVKRMTAIENDPDYGRLSVMTAFYADAQMLFEVPPSAFIPAPKVTSAIVSLQPRPQREDVDEELLGDIVNRAFSMRRKTVRNSLKSYLSAEELESIDIDPGLRPENLSLEDYVRCAGHVEKRSQGRSA